MTISEVETYEFGLSPDEQLGFALSMSREELRDVLYNDPSSNDRFEVAMVEYLNAVQGFYFECSEGQHYDVISNTTTALVTEAQTLLKRKIDDSDGIAKRLADYMDDKNAQILAYNNLPTLPRAFSMTLLDTINTYRPEATPSETA